MLLLGGIAALDRRGREYLNRENSGELSAEVVKTYLEEVRGRCTTLQEEALSSIENWTDIVPGADLKTQIGVITDLTEQAGVLQSELTTLQKESEASQDKSEEEIKDLQSKIKDKESEVSKAKRELAAARSSSSLNLFGNSMEGWRLEPNRIILSDFPLEDISRTIDPADQSEADA